MLAVNVSCIFYHGYHYGELENAFASQNFESRHFDSCLLVKTQYSTRFPQAVLFQKTMCLDL